MILAARCARSRSAFRRGDDAGHHHFGGAISGKPRGDRCAGHAHSRKASCRWAGVPERPVMARTVITDANNGECIWMGCQRRQRAVSRICEHGGRNREAARIAPPRRRKDDVPFELWPAATGRREDIESALQASAPAWGCCAAAMCCRAAGGRAGQFVFLSILHCRLGRWQW